MTEEQEGLMMREKPQERREEIPQTSLDKVVANEPTDLAVQKQAKQVNLSEYQVKYVPLSPEEGRQRIIDAINDALKIGADYDYFRREGITKEELREYGYKVRWNDRIVKTDESELAAKIKTIDEDGDGIHDVVEVNGHRYRRECYQPKSEASDREEDDTSLGSEFLDEIPEEECEREKVDNERFYRMAVDNELNEELRVLALYKLGDEELKTIVLQPSTNELIRTKALERIQDNKLLQDIIENYN